MAPAEIWRPVVGYEDLYEVSDLGRVRSFWFGNSAGTHRRRAPHILSASGQRYPAVTLSRDGVKSRLSVHRLVLTAFVGPCPDGMECAHLNGSHADPKLSNLAWKTHRENIADKVAHGTHQVGERNPQALLTKSAVIAIRRDYRRGSRTYGGPALGRRYGVCPNAILAVVHGVNWSSAAMAA